MQSPRPVPSEKEWRSESWGLDTPYAYAHFLGRTYEEAVRQPRDRPDLYWEDFLYMPPTCLRYYIWAMIEHLKAAISEGSNADLSRFVSIVEARGPDLAGDSLLSESCEAMLSHIDRFYCESIDLQESLTTKARLALNRR